MQYSRFKSCIQLRFVIIEYMNVQDNKIFNGEEKDTLCISCKRFYGSQAFSHMCSQCYKKQQSNNSSVKPLQQKAQTIFLTPKKDQPKVEQEKKVVNKERCTTCNRKLKLLGIECRCGMFFCNQHRLPQDHNCSFNHKGLAKQRLAKQNVKVEKGKIQYI